jgi:hypothetical protein
MQIIMICIITLGTLIALTSLKPIINCSIFKAGQDHFTNSGETGFKSVVFFICTEDKLDELKIIFLEEEIKELKHALREARNRNSYLTQVIEQNEDVKKKQ